jgi:hypothetical protein
MVAGITTQLRTKSNHSATANHHNSQITTPPAKPFPAYCAFTSRSLATAFDSWDSSASRAQVLPSPTTAQNRLPLIVFVFLYPLGTDRTEDTVILLRSC